MAIDATIHHDAEGRAVLTHEQAEALARMQTAPATRAGQMYKDAAYPFARALVEEAEATGMPYPEMEIEYALARYVLRWAPVVRAAEAQEEAISHMTAKPGGASVWTESDYARWQGATDATERAVRAARGEGEPPP